eukprot:4932351-Pleurochrysis_carterae.AAC.3
MARSVRWVRMKKSIPRSSMEKGQSSVEMPFGPRLLQANWNSALGSSFWCCTIPKTGGCQRMSEKVRSAFTNRTLRGEHTIVDEQRDKKAMLCPTRMSDAHRSIDDQRPLVPRHDRVWMLQMQPIAALKSVRGLRANTRLLPKEARSEAT